jgi:hypothetical protein
MEFQDVAPLANYHGEREAKAVAEMLSHPRPAITGKSVGKPRRRNTNPQQTCETEGGGGNGRARM